MITLAQLAPIPPAGSSCPIKPPVLEERVAPFRTGGSFYRRESIFSRDLAVLSGVIHKREVGHLNVLDLMAGSGIRGVRYLQHAEADMVHCNDISTRLHDTQVANLGAAVERRWGEACQPLQYPVPLINGDFTSWEPTPTAKCILSHVEATRMLMWLSLSNSRPDVIDADGFGAQNLRAIISLSLSTIKYGGLLCLACTSGPLASGRNPASALGLLGAQIRNVPYANEQGLRALLGLAASEAMSKKLRIQPLWSLYSPHGPVYRCMIRVLPCSSAQQAQQDLGYVVHNVTTGNSQALTWDELVSSHSHRNTKSREEQGSGSAIGDGGGIETEAPSIVASGPLWIGKLHDIDHLHQIREEAGSRGWLNDLSKDDNADPNAALTKKGRVVWSLDELLNLMQEESDADFPPWHLDMCEIGRWGRLKGPPSREGLMQELRGRGYKAGRTHIATNALKTNASLEEVIAAAKVVSNPPHSPADG